MPLTLEQIETLTFAEDQSRIDITMTSGAKVALIQKESPPLLSETWTWLSRSHSLGKPVALDVGAATVLPATVALEVAARVTDDGAQLVVSGAPRPGLMQLDRSAAYAAAVQATISHAATEGTGAVFALRGGVWIEDARAIPVDTARKLLGFGR